MSEEKLDALLKSVESLKKDQSEGQRDLQKRLDHLEREVASGQEDATQRVVKRLKEDRTLVFRKKGNERQLFNEDVKDQLDAVGKHLNQLEPPSEGITTQGKRRIDKRSRIDSGTAKTN